MIAVCLCGLIVLPINAQSDNKPDQSSSSDQKAKSKPAGPPDGAPQGPPPANVRVGLVKVEKVQQRRLVTGRIEARWRSTVAAEESGRVVDAPPESGTTIKAGEVLAKIDDTLLKLDLVAAKTYIEQAQAQINVRKEELALHERERERITKVVNTRAAQEKELLDQLNREAVAKARLVEAQAMLRLREAEYQRLQARLEKTKIMVPFDAVTVNKQAELGQWLAPGDPVSEIIAIDLVKALINIPEYMIHLVNVGDELDVRIDALNEIRRGKVFRIVSSANQQSRTFPASVRLKNDDETKILLRPGMSVGVELPTSTIVDAITVPRDAVHTTPNGQVVHVVRNGVGVATPVSVLYGVGDRFAIKAPLANGDLVVTEGNERLRPGQPLNIQNNPTPTPEQAKTSTPEQDKTPQQTRNE